MGAVNADANVDVDVDAGADADADATTSAFGDRTTGIDALAAAALPMAAMAGWPVSLPTADARVVRRFLLVPRAIFGLGIEIAAVRVSPPRRRRKAATACPADTASSGMIAAVVRLKASSSSSPSLSPPDVLIRESSGLVLPLIG